MRRDGLTIRSMTSMVAVLLSAGLVGCNRGPQEVTSIQFDGQDRSITTQDVVCSKQPDGGLLIAVAGGSHQTVRVQLTEQGRTVVQKVGLRYDDMAGFVSDPQEVTATKVDDTFPVSGRMPPNPGEVQWHTFKIETTCPEYREVPPPSINNNPGNGAP